MPASMHYDAFAALAGKACRLESLDREGPAVDLPAVLVEVGERKERYVYEQFALLFKATEAGWPQQGNYRVTFEGDDPREIFLVPVARSGDQVDYEAVFYRTPPAA